MQAQTDLDRRYGDKLATLAKQLGEASSAIRQRGELGSAFLRNVTERFGHIAQATGSALMSLQSGDSLRQRLEHVRDGVERIMALDGGDLGADPPIPEDARDSTVMRPLSAAARADHGRRLDLRGGSRSASKAHFAI